MPSSIKKNFFYNGVLSVVQVITPLVTFPYIARVLTPEGLGKVTIAESVTRYFILFAALGIPIYGMREVAKVKEDKNQIRKIFIELFTLHLVLSLFLLIGFPFVSSFFSLGSSYILVGSIMILSNVFLLEWMFQGLEKFSFITKRSIIVRIIVVGATFFLIKEKSDSVIYFGLICLTSVLNSGWNFFTILKEYSPQFFFNNIRVKIHIKPLLYIFSSLAFISIYTLLDTLMLGVFTDDATVGYYATGVKFSRVPIMFISALGSVMIPRLSEFYKKNMVIEYSELIDKSIRVILIFSIPLFFLLISLSKEIILFFAGSQYTRSIIVLQILSISSLLIGLSNIFGLQILTAMSKDKLFTQAVMIGTCISLLMNCFLIPLYNEVGAAIVSVIAELTVTYFTFLYAKRFIKINFQYRLFIKLIISSAPIILLPKFFYLFSSSIIIVLIGSAMSGFFYLLLIQIFFLKETLIINIIKKIYA
jgi:O-antigen/teichoic acid export membrane protein